jgi:hypothetical protein
MHFAHISILPRLAVAANVGSGSLVKALTFRLFGEAPSRGVRADELEQPVLGDFDGFGELLGGRRPDIMCLRAFKRVGKEEVGMPLYMDRHKNLEGLTAEAVAEDHKKDLEVQDKHGAKALRYWFNEEKGEVYCLFEAPNAEAAEAVHREAHGNVADEIVEVREGS